MSYKTDQSYLLLWAKKIMTVNQLGGKCSVCGEDDFRKLDIHHIDSSKKDITFNALRFYRWSEIQTDLKNCMLMCRNHHSESHFCGKPGWKDNLLDLVGSRACSKCGYIGANVSSLDFHHTGDKGFSVSDGYKGDRLLMPIEDLLSEIKKCVVLCRNCHGLEHIDTNRLSEMMPKILFKVNGYKEKQIPVSRDKVVRLRNEGLGVCEIARSIGCAKSTISVILSKFNGVKTRI